MTHTPPTGQQLDEYEARARAAVGSWGVYEHGNDGSVTDITAEVRRLRAEAPDPAAQAAPVKPTSHTWTFEVCYDTDAGKWQGCGHAYDDSVFDNAHETAQEDFQHRAENDKQRRRFRMTRATTTYAVEAEYAPAVVSQPDAEA
jgi:hypothetical protein